ncbi:MAG: ATP-binding protein [Oscillospiraceae bacterium]|nr:ATP-binding protein [Oscillospiraceae bacterium]
MTYINRSMEPVFLELSREYPAILITGPRQVGKTTMLQKLSEKESRNRTYISLDDLNERKLAKTDPAMFFQLHKPPIFIDEVQYAPELFPYIKILIDKHNNPGDFWLTGSQLFKLMSGVQESLAGRVALLHLSPLSQREIYQNGQSATPFCVDLDVLSVKQNTVTSASVSEIYERIFNGGMPALVSGRYTNRETFYSSYIGTYLDRDVKELSGTIDSMKFHNFITAVAALTAQMVNYKAIADDCDIDQTTAKAWLRILETLGIIFYLYPYSNNTLKRLVKTPKLYFYDSGLVAYLTKWNSAETLQNGAMSGAILENYVVSEMVKSYQNAGREPFIYYYRDKDSKEIDVLLERDGKLFPLEIKKTAMPGSQLTRVFKVLDKSSLQRGTGAVICMAEKLGALDRDNLIVPVWLV